MHSPIRLMRNILNDKLGQSLVEVVIAIGVVALLVTGLVVGTTAALKSSRLGRLRSGANKYAQEGVELTRDLRDAGWISFQARNGLYCLAQDNIFPAAPSGSCTINIDSIYTRSILFAWNDPRMQVTATVSWSDGTVTHQSQLITYFTRWQ